jgi:succinoglycan biosynthesis protein ExoL
MQIRKKITFLVPDISDARVIKRVKAFQVIGGEIVISGFRRVRYKYDDTIYNNLKIIFLGKTSEKKYFKRVLKILLGIIKIFKYLKIYKNSNCLYCINIDMLFIGIFLKIFFNVKIFYEVGDILNPFLGKKLHNILLRNIERIMLMHTNMIILTSPAFYYKFYKPVQKLKRPWILLENKLIPTNKTIFKKNKNFKKRKIAIVYHGVLRCQYSIDILMKVAMEFSEKCELHLHGIPLWVNLDSLHRMENEYKNIFWHGEYKYPFELTKILSRADLLWLVDLSENISNAKWLLPNRLYDGIYCGVPMLAMRNTEAGNYIEKYNFGWCLGENVLEDLRSFIFNISIKDIINKKKIFNEQTSGKGCSLDQYKKIYDLV